MRLLIAEPDTKVGSIEEISFADSRLPVKFWRWVVPVLSTGCWIWSGNRDYDGYGRVTIGGSKRRAHRHCYANLIGSIPAGLELDHLCRITSCVNPAHLEPVTPRENKLRGFGVSGINARKTHCPRGHAYTEVNTSIHAGQRFCRTCNREACRNYKLRIKEQLA